MIPKYDKTCYAHHSYDAADLIQSTCNVITLEDGHVFPKTSSKYNDLMAAELDRNQECLGQIIVPNTAVATNVYSALLSLLILIFFY